MIDCTARDGDLPISFNQDALLLADWLAALRGAPRVPFNPVITQSLPASPDLLALEAALNALVARHEILRTGFTDIASLSWSQHAEISARIGNSDLVASSVFAQRLHDTGRVELSVIRAGGDVDDDVRRVLRDETHRLFDYGTPPLIRAMVVERPQRGPLLVLVLHHLVCDRWSLVVMQRELRQLYRAHAGGQAVSGLADLPIQYADFAAWQRREVQRGRFDEMLAYWTARWSEFLPDRLVADDLPFARPTPAAPAFGSGLEALVLDPALSTALRQFARNKRLTLYVCWLTVVVILLHAHSQKTRMALFGNLANRAARELESLIGWTANSCLFGVTIDPDATVAALLLQVRDVVLDAQARQAMPAAALWAAFLKQRQAFDFSVGEWTAVDFISAAERTPQPLLDDEGRVDERPKGTAVPAALTRTTWRAAMTDTGSSLVVNCQYSLDRFAADDIRQMVDDLRRVIERLVVAPEDRIADVAAALRPIARSVGSAR